jgi:hypothetical protein
MSVDNLAGTTGRAGSRPVSRESDKEGAPPFPMSVTLATLHEQALSPHSHRPYYRSLLKKT